MSLTTDEKMALQKLKAKLSIPGMAYKTRVFFENQLAQIEATLEKRLKERRESREA
jgi:ABC-type uncharacterized transport system ATPase component